MMITIKGCFSIFFVCIGCMAIAQESYTISPESVLTITGTSTVHDWEVTANAIQGSIIANEKVISDLDIEVPVIEIKSERGAAMDDKMHVALKSEQHPMVFFKFKELGQKGALHGILMIAGVEQEIEVAGKFDASKDRIGVSGTHEIELAAFGMEPPTAMFGQIVVGDTVSVRFDLIFLKE